MQRYIYILVLLNCVLIGQHRGDPMGFQSIDNIYSYNLFSPLSGMPNSISSNDLGEMFVNPASLASLKNSKLSFSLFSNEKEWWERQEYRPNRQLVTLPFILEGLFVPNRDYDGWYDHEAFLQDTMYLVQDPDLGADVYEKNASDWQEKKSRDGIDRFMIGFPLHYGDKNIVLAFSFINNLLLDNYDRNQTHLNPHPAWDGYSDMPDRVTGAEDSIRVTWSDYERNRLGALNSWTFNCSYSLTTNLSIGLTYNKISGDTDDMVQLETIGHFDILEGYNTYKFRYDSERHNTQGTSKFNISNISIGGIINGEKYRAGINVMLPHKIKRQWEYNYVKNMVDSSSSSIDKGFDRMDMPITISYNIYFKPHEKFALSSNYINLPFNNADFTYAGDDSLYSKWIDKKLFSFGLSYWLPSNIILTAGLQTMSQSYIPDGQAFNNIGPISKSIVFGLQLPRFPSGGVISVFYQKNTLKYYDLYFSNTNWTSENFNRLDITCSISF